MKISQKLGLAIGIAFLTIAFSSALANDIYVSQNPSGANNGADCSDARGAVWFNTSSNWGSGASQIGPGDTVHLCGTWTGTGGQQFLSAQGSGTSASPITILFEPGAILQAPYFSTNGAISVSGKSYITIDGGSNGLIQNTANGSSGGTCPAGGCSNQQDSTGVRIIQCAGCVVQNLSVNNMYVHTSLSDTAWHNVYSIYGYTDTNLTIANNTVNESKWCIFYAYGPSDTNLVLDGNKTYHCDHNLAVGNGDANTSLTGLVVKNNVGHDMMNWDDNSNSNHHSCMHFWAVASGAQIKGPYQIFDNYCYGDFGSHATAGFFIEANSGGTQTGLTMFNNLIDHQSTSNAAPNGLVYTQAGNCSIYNNTFRDAGGTGGNGWNGIDFAGSGCSLHNNIFSGMNIYLYVEAGVALTADNNEYFNSASGWDYHGTFTNSVANWRSACNCDPNANTNDPKLAADLTLQTGSGAIGAGGNLTNLGINPLDVDKAQVPRPTGSTPWAIGSFQFGSAQQPNAPSGLSASVN